MRPTSACPDAHVLERLVLGRLSGGDTEQIEEHVSHCARCAERLLQIRGDDPLVNALRHTSSLDPAQTDLVEKLIPNLKRLRGNPGQTMSDTALSREPTAMLAGDQSSFDFLAPPQRADEIGRLGSWRVLRVLGAGGMGVVFLADDPRLKRHIALKVIKPELVQKPELRQRFMREAESMAAIEHENIVTVYHVEEDRGVPLLAMPLLRGETLEERIHAVDGPLPLDEVLRIGREIASGLGAAHDRGLIHRDIKPGNIFLEGKREEGRGKREEGTAANTSEDTSPLVPRPSSLFPAKVKILDFGLARAVRGNDTALSHEGSIMGTPAYMAPEQARGHATDARADLFSLGCVLYRMATGQPAFAGSDFVSLLLSVASDTPRCPRELNPELPRELSDLIEQLIAKNPQQRPDSAHAVIEIIQAIERRRQPRPSRRGVLILSVLVLAATGTAIALALNRPEPKPTPVTEPSPADVTFEFAEQAEPFTIQRGDEEPQLVKLKDGKGKQTLPVGTYKVRAKSEKPGRKLRPELFEVKDTDKQVVTLHVVGELDHAETGRTIWALALSPRKDDWTVVCGLDDGTLGFWNAAGGDDVKFAEGHTAPVRSVAISPDGGTVVSGSGGKVVQRRHDTSIRFWSMNRQQAPGTISEHRTWVEALAFSADGGKVLSGDKDGKVFVWDARTRQKLGELVGHSGLGIHGVAFSVDGTLAVTAGGDRTAIVWDVAQSKMLQRLEGHTEAVRGVAFLPGVEHIVSASMDGSIRIWDWKKHSMLRLLEVKEKQAVDERGLRCLSVTPDGKRLVTGGHDGVVRLWDVESGKQLERFVGHKGDVYSVACSADGRRVVSGGSDRTIRLWGLPR